MVSQKRYEALRHNRNFSKLSAEFMIFALSKNVQYIFLVLETLTLFGLSHFNVRVRYLPNITILGEWHNFTVHTYNPFWLYYRFLEIFFATTKNIALYMWDTVSNNLLPGVIICFLIVGIWLAYKNMSYGYSSRESQRRNVFWTKLKNVLFESHLLERSLWMTFFVEVLGFVLTPQPTNIIALIVVWLLMLSIKATPLFSNIVVDLTEKLEKSIFYSKYALWIVTILDVLLVYFDSERLFALFIMIIAYCAIAQLVFFVFKKVPFVLKWLHYIFNLGIFIFFFGIVIVYYLSFAVVSVVLVPAWAYFFLVKKKAIPPKVMEVLTGVCLVVLLVVYFK